MSDRQAAENQELRERVEELEEQLSEAIGVGQLSADAATERGAENKRLRATIHNELPMLEVESPASFRRIRAALKEKP